jgi:hypothetical protein
LSVSQPFVPVIVAPVPPPPESPPEPVPKCNAALTLDRVLFATLIVSPGERVTRTSAPTWATDWA